MKPENVNVLREALPFINKFNNKVFVIKFGGEVADDRKLLQLICEEIALCQRVGIKVVVVHGGGKQATELQEKLGLEPKIINGRRVTDEGTLEVVKMVFGGKLNTDIVLLLRKVGAEPVGLSGVDAGIIDAAKRPPQMVTDSETGKKQKVDFGFVGDIKKVDTTVLTTLIDRDFIPVIASLAADDEGNVYNVNADTVAAALAGGLQAEKLILASDVDGILGKDGKPISRLSAAECKNLVADKIITGGMIPKVESALSALKQGVKSVHIINGTRSGSLLEEVFTMKGAGTMISVS
jgi:acetylglutamate kinase